MAARSGTESKRDYARERRKPHVRARRQPAPRRADPNGHVALSRALSDRPRFNHHSQRALYRVWDNNVQRSALILELATPSHQQAALALEQAAPLLELDHPGIASIQVIFVERDTLFMGLAFGGGQTIADIITNRNTPMPAASAVRWIIQAAEVADFLDSRLPSWSFGDLSASALILTSEDRVQLLGFEIPLHLVSPSTMAQKLPAGSVAPELRDDLCDARSDVYSLAATLYFLLTGQSWNPEAGATQSLSDLRPDLPNDLLYVIRRGLATPPGERWENAAAWQNALTNALPPEQTATIESNQPAAADDDADSPTLVTSRGHLQSIVDAEAAARATAQTAADQPSGADALPSNDPGEPGTLPLEEIAAAAFPAAAIAAALDAAHAAPLDDGALGTADQATPVETTSTSDDASELPYSMYPWLRNDHVNEPTGATGAPTPDVAPESSLSDSTPRATRWFDVPRLPDGADPFPGAPSQTSWLEMPIVEPAPQDWNASPLAEEAPTAATTPEPAAPVDLWLPSWLREDQPAPIVTEQEPLAEEIVVAEAMSTPNLTDSGVAVEPPISELETAQPDAVEAVVEAAPPSLFNRFVIPPEDVATPPPSIAQPYEDTLRNTDAPATVTPIPLNNDRPFTPSSTPVWPNQSFEAKIGTPAATPSQQQASTQSKTPSRPLGVLLDRLRGALGGPTSSVGSTGTIVLPKHMYPQHVYSILVRLQRWSANRTGDTGVDGVITVEVEGSADAFYLPVKRLALQTLASGGLSEGTLTVTAQRPTPHGGSDRLTFTFYGSGGQPLHQSQFVAEISILAPNQMTTGTQMITLVHALDL